MDFQEVLAGNADLLHSGGDLFQTVQVQSQVGCQVHVGVAGGHGEGLVVGLGGQIQSEAVVPGISQLGQSALAVAGDEQMVQVLTDHFSGLDGADRLGGVAGTAEVDQQGGLGAGQSVLGIGNDIGGSVGLDLEVVLLVQGVVQGIAHELTGAGTGQNDVEILGLDNLVQELLQFLLAGGKLGAGLAPGGGLLVDLVDRKGRGRSGHLFFGVVENAHC